VLLQLLTTGVMNINELGKPAYCGPSCGLVLADCSRTWASILARHVTYRSATAKMAAGDMLELSIAFWKEFNSGDLQVSTVARLVANDSR